MDLGQIGYCSECWDENPRRLGGARVGDPASVNEREIEKIQVVYERAKFPDVPALMNDLDACLERVHKECLRAFLDHCLDDARKYAARQKRRARERL